MRGEPSFPRLAETVVDADAAFDDHLAEASSEAPMDDLGTQRIEKPSKIRGRIQLEFRGRRLAALKSDYGLYPAPAVVFIGRCHSR